MSNNYKYFSLPDPEDGLSPSDPSSPLYDNEIELERRERSRRLRKKWIFALVIIFTLVIIIFAVIVVFERLFENYHSLPPSSAVGMNGAVSTEHGTCSDIGLSILKAGGNAVDAAIASGLCIGTLNSFSSGIGGGGFMIIRDGSGAHHGIDFRETAPAAASEKMFVDNPILSEIGGLSVAVPGEIRGYYEAFSKYGKLEWHKLVEPSINLARNGFPVTSVMESRLKEEADFILNTEGFNETFVKDGRLVMVGDTIYRPNYADTLEAIAKGGPTAFYEGEIAEDSIATIQKNGGIMTMEDLKSYSVKTPEPLIGWYHGKRIVTSDAPASGSILISILNILEKFNFPREGRTPRNIHRLVEAFKFAYAQRTELGDPDYVTGIRERIEQIISKSESESLRANLTDNTHPWEYYNPKFETMENHGTTHISTLDKDQIAVTVTSTINLSFGSKVMSPKTGIIFNDHMDDFSTPNKTNYFGLRPSKNNYIAPGKRPLSSSVPTIVENDGNVELVIGASGGSKITTAVCQVLLNILDFNMDTQEAITSRRLHHQLLPDHVSMEHGYAHGTAIDLRARGHTVKELAKESSLADVQAIYRFPTGKLHAGADKRKGGVAVAY